MEKGKTFSKLSVNFLRFNNFFFFTANDFIWKAETEHKCSLLTNNISAL